MENYYISETNSRGNHAGTKARNDIDIIFGRLGFSRINKECIRLYERSNGEIEASYNSRFGNWRILNSARKIKNSRVFIQYPMLMFDKQKELYTELSSKNELILIVHDVHSLKSMDESSIIKEIELLNIADGLVLHNSNMHLKLKSYGLKTLNVAYINIFDYLVGQDDIENREKSQYITSNIAFAGNLNKSEFLKNIDPKRINIHFNLYGPGFIFHDKMSDHLVYHGNYLPDEIPKIIAGKFGLVWDGTSADTVEGSYGEYTKYNTPHKMSLYLVSGIPLIVWKKSAISHIVEDLELGITVESIYDIEKELNKISIDEYAKYKSNVMSIKDKLMNGIMLQEAISKFIE